MENDIVLTEVLENLRAVLRAALSGCLINAPHELAAGSGAGEHGILCGHLRRTPTRMSTPIFCVYRTVSVVQHRRPANPVLEIDKYIETLPTPRPVRVPLSSAKILSSPVLAVCMSCLWWMTLTSVFIGPSPHEVCACVCSPPGNAC